MLLLEATIRFDETKDNPDALPNNLSTKNILRPSINFGNNLLFSGTIKANEEVETIFLGTQYEVTIDMPTIEHEAYDAIKDMLKEGHGFLIQNASRVIGRGTIKNFLYEKN